MKILKEYPAYKDSGVEWLGNVPEHWEIRKLKYISNVRPSNVDKKSVEGELPVKLCNYIDVYSNDHIISETNFMSATASQSQIKRFSLKHGDVLITKDSEAWDDIAVPAYITENLPDVLCGYHLAHISPNQKHIYGNYLFRAFSSFPIRDQFCVAANGITRFGLSKNSISSGLFLVPPLDEQQAIADFLDRRTGQIDDLIAKKERVIELLREKRTAIISHAVTKGLNPDVKMKDSRIDWLGKVPEHWEVKRLKRISKKIQTGCTPPTAQEYYYEDGTISWYGPGNFGDDLILGEASKLINESAIKDGVARLFEAGSTMIVAIGATIGKVGYIDKPASSNQQITAVAPNIAKVLGKFLAYQLKHLEQVLKGIAPNTTLPIMDQQKIGCLMVANPPISEQQAIADFLDRETSKIDALIAKVTEAIEKLKEYRTALISAAVTGKIDVREGVV